MWGFWLLGWGENKPKQKYFRVVIFSAINGGKFPSSSSHLIQSSSMNEALAEGFEKSKLPPGEAIFKFTINEVKGVY